MESIPDPPRSPRTMWFSAGVAESFKEPLLEVWEMLLLHSELQKIVDLSWIKVTELGVPIDELTQASLKAIIRFIYFHGANHVQSLSARDSWRHHHLSIAPWWSSRNLYDIWMRVIRIDDCHTKERSYFDCFTHIREFLKTYNSKLVRCFVPSWFITGWTAYCIKKQIASSGCTIEWSLASSVNLYDGLQKRNTAMCT